MPQEVIPEYVKKRVLILGVGNVLFGDDGFGPATIDYMVKSCRIPRDVYVMDVGIGAGEVLFTVALSPERLKKIIVLDAVHLNKKPGEVFKLAIEDLPENKITDFSLHLFPAANLLKELRDRIGIEIVILACQAKKMPEIVDPGLSKIVQRSVPKAAMEALRLAK